MESLSAAKAKQFFCIEKTENLKKWITQLCFYSTLTYY